MSILYYDCFAGISGDMNLAALINLGVDKNYLVKELKKLKLSGWDIITSIDNRKGIFGIRVDVVLKNENNTGLGFVPTFTLPQTIHATPVKSQHQHRSYTDIKQIIETSSLPLEVKETSLRIFLKIGEAEAKIHNKTINEIHFHEVGAIDSIIDIVGAAICIHFLKPDKIIACPIQLGGGMVKCEHGLLPVPAPATTEILKGIPVKTGLVNYEATTPTGAAILATIVNEFTNNISFTIEKTAYGIGHKNDEIPNVLRVHWANSNSPTQFLTDQVTVIDCNIDDMNPELYEPVINNLFANGALDVFETPVLMKKMRPATLLSVICNNQQVNLLSEIILTQTTAIGLRYYTTHRNMLQRQTITVATQWGNVNVKKALLPNGTAKYKPEYAHCLNIATTNGIALNEVYNRVNEAILKQNQL